MQKNDFIEFLKKHKKESYFLVSAPGNSGDLLLRKGLELYLKNNKFKVVKKIKKADSILIHGGANISDIWESGIKIFKTVTKQYPNKKIIIAPHTCYFFKTDFEKILNNCKQEIHFFAREKKSFDRLSKMNLNNNIHIYLANDTAFLLENSLFINNLRKENLDKYILYAFRTDRESSLFPKIFSITDPHYEKSLWYWSIKRKFVLNRIKKFIKKNKINQKDGKILIKDVSYENLESFINLIKNASVIYTDRLHVGILGGMLGKRVYLFKTRYDKVQGVYENTLKDNYPNVVNMF